MLSKLPPRSPMNIVLLPWLIFLAGFAGWV
jgi:hypothetical protein